MKKPDPIRSIFRTACALLALLALLPRPALAQLEVAALNTAYTITFDATVAGVNNGAFTGSGFAPHPPAGSLTPTLGHPPACPMGHLLSAGPIPVATLPGVPQPAG